MPHIKHRMSSEFCATLVAHGWKGQYLEIFVNFVVLAHAAYRNLWPGVADA
jgi:hypothetical protein